MATPNIDEQTLAAATPDVAASIAPSQLDAQQAPQQDVQQPPQFTGPADANGVTVTSAAQMPGSRPATADEARANLPSRNPAGKDRKGFVDFSERFAQEGLEFIGLDPATNQPRVLDKQTGKTGTFPLDKMLASEKLSRNDLNIQFNTPQTALPKSPLTVLQRLNYGTTSNDKGLAKTLTKQFDEVVLPTKDNGLDGIVVKKNGVYSKIDPGFFEGMSPTEIAADIAEFAPAAIATGVLTAAATTVGAPVALAAAVGGLGYGAIKTTLGRIQGTYDATPEEQLGDIGLEALYNLGGLAIGVGGKIVGPKVIGAMRAIKDGASSTVRESLASLVGVTTKAGAVAADTMIEHAPQVTAAIKAAFVKGGQNATSDSVAEGLAQHKAGLAKSFLEKATEALPRKYTEGLRTLLRDAGEKGVSFDMQEIVGRSMAALEEQGVGKFVEQTAKDGTTKTIFRALEESEKVASGLADLPIGAFAEIEGVANTLLRYSKDGVLKGGTGAARLAALNRALNDLSRNATGGTRALQAVTDKVTEAAKAGIRENFASQGLAEQWIKVNAPYIKYSNSVNAAHSILNSQEGIYTFADKLTRAAGKRGSATNIAQDLQELIGAEGKELYHNILITNAAMKFTPKAPQFGIGAILAGSIASPVAMLNPVVGGAIGAVGGALSSPRLMLGATNAAQTSGRLAAKLLPSAEKLGDFIKYADKNMRGEMLRNPAVLGQALKTVMEGAGYEEQLKDSLLKSVK